MSSGSLPQLGSVVWAELADANGFRKRRPAVVVTATDDIVAGKTVRLLAITTRVPTPLPEDRVLLPWDGQGKARSGLRRRCAAVTSWQAEVPVGEQTSPPLLGSATEALPLVRPVHRLDRLSLHLCQVERFLIGQDAEDGRLGLEGARVDNPDLDVLIVPETVGRTALRAR